MTHDEHAAISAKAKIALGRLSAAIDEWNPIAVFGLFSGGHDSFSACYVATHHRQCREVVHINTNTGVEATRDYVLDTCWQRGWRLREFKAVENMRADGTIDPQDYRAMVLRHGFPGPAGHRYMYIRLKERALKMLARHAGADCRGKIKRRIMLVSGCRSEESDRRMGTVNEVQLHGREVWVAPIHDWSKLDTSHLLELADQPRNPVVDLIHKSGECLCGAFAKPGELEELGLWPITRPAYDRIKALEIEVRAAGHNWGWGERPPKKGKIVIHEPPGPLCWSCGKQQEFAL